jgi:hypothetical protein
MFQRGDWVVPMFNGQMFPEKPPLMFWTMMAGFELFGVNEWGARFFSAVLGVGTALVAFHLGRILANDRVGLWTGLITASTLVFTISARAATVDSALTFVTTLAFLMFAIGWKKAARSGLPAEGSGVDDAGKPDPVLYTPGPENLNADPKTQNAKSAANALGFVEKAPTPLGSHSERSEESAKRRICAKSLGTKRSFATLRMTRGLLGTSLTRLDAHAAAFDRHPPGGDQSQRFGVGLALGRENPGGKRLGHVVVQDRHRPLHDHRAMVVLVVGEVDRAAAELGPVFQHRLVDAVTVESFAAKRGHQRGVNIDHAIGEILGDGDPLEEPAHHDQIGSRAAAVVEDCPAEIVLAG